MGKKTTKRKTRWRTLSIGEVPQSDTEEEINQDSVPHYHYYNANSIAKLRGFNGTTSPSGSGSYQQNGGSGRPPSHRNNSHSYYNNSTTYSTSPSSFYHPHSSKYPTNNQASTTQSSHSTPIRNRYSSHNRSSYLSKSSRSNSTASEPKITFNEDEYTRITTPRQDVLFKKGYLSKKKPLVSVDLTQTTSSSNSEAGNTIPLSGSGGNSCGESNPSTGYNSTTGGGTPEHHSLDGGDFYDTDIDQQQQFIFHNGFVDQTGVFYVNGYDPYPMMLIGPPPPPGQFMHPVDFFPPHGPATGLPCFQQVTPSTSVFNSQVDSASCSSSKRYSTDSQAESNSPLNEIDSSSGEANFASSEQSQSKSSSSSHLDSSGVPKALLNVAIESTSDNTEVQGDGFEKPAETDQNGDISTIVEQPDTSNEVKQAADVQIPVTDPNKQFHGMVPLMHHPALGAPIHHRSPLPHPGVLMQSPNGQIFMAPFMFAPPGASTIHTHSNPDDHIHHQHPGHIYFNDTNNQSSRVLNNGIVDSSKQRITQKRRRKKHSSKSQNGVDNSSDYSDSTADECEIENRKQTTVEDNETSKANDDDEISNDETPTMESTNDETTLLPEKKEPTTPVNVSNDKNESTTLESKPSSIIYKVDAQEFIPRAMRGSSHDSSTVAENISPELRAKFENYLDRQDEFVFTPSMSLPSRETKLIDDLSGTSFPPHKSHYIDALQQRKSNFNNSFNNRKRHTKCNQQNFYGKPPYRKYENEKVLKTQTSQTEVLEKGEIVEKKVETETENVKTAQEEVVVVVEVDNKKLIENNVEELKSKVEEVVNNHVDISEVSKIVVEESIVPKSAPKVIRQNSKPKTPEKTNVTPIVQNSKNYAQIVRKVEEPKEVKVSLKSNKTSSPIKNNKVNSHRRFDTTNPAVNNQVSIPVVQAKSAPTTPVEPPEESEWISVPTRKKGKLKTIPNYSISYLENYVEPEVKETKVIDVEIPKEEPVKEKIPEPKPIKPSPVKKQKSVTKTTPNKSKKPVASKVEKAKTPPPKTEEEPSKKPTKPKIRKSNSKEGTPSLTHQVPNNIAIGESIDNLRKMASSEEYAAKTNIDISQEMDRMIQQGLYKNLGDKIKEFDHDNEFLSLINNDVTKITLKPKITNDAAPIFDFNIMETLSECQKFFATKKLPEEKKLTEEKNLQETSTDLISSVEVIESSKPKEPEDEPDLSDNDDTLLSTKFDSTENISTCEVIITEEQQEPVDILVTNHSPDPDSWSSHTNLNSNEKITEPLSNNISISEYNTANNVMTKSLTEVVTEWLHEAKEKSPPDVDILKSPEKIYREKSAPPTLYRQYSGSGSADESNDEVASENQSKNVKGNPLFAASVNNTTQSTQSFLTLVGETCITTSVRPGAVIGEDALLVNRRVASKTAKTQTVATDTERNSRLEDIKRNTKKIKENVSTFARELVKTVNPVVDGMNLTIEGGDDEEEELFSCCEVNEHTDLTRDNEPRIMRGAYVRDIGVIKRTVVSENGAILNNLNVNNNNNKINKYVNNTNNVNKSKSCVNMKLLIVNEKKQNVSTTSSREGSEELEFEELWDNELMNNEKPLKQNGVTKIEITNNLELVKEKNKKQVDDSNEIIEAYESVYGKNLDYLEIREKVLNECEQQRTINHLSDQPCTVANGAACCSVM